MGSYFANLHIRKNDKNQSASIEKLIVDYFEKRGITVSDSESADIEVAVFSPDGSEWISVCADAFTHEDILALAPSVSSEFASDVLSAACFDSDYLFLNLLNKSDSTDAWLNIGKSYEIKAPRRSNVAAWKKKIRDFESFKIAAKEKYICAEEFLFSVADNLALSSEQIIGCELPEDCVKLYFTAPAKEDVDPTYFVLPTCSPDIYKIGKNECCGFYNTGSASRGIAVMFTGNYVEKEEITFENTKIRITKGSWGNFASFPIALQKISLSDGSWAYYWEDKSFKIPERVSTDLPPMVYLKKTFTRTITVDFVPQGNPRKVLDIKVTMIPLSNPIDGQCSWCLGEYYGSKKAFIEQHNQHAKELEEKCPYAPVEYFNPDDYDLD